MLDDATEKVCDLQTASQSLLGAGIFPACDLSSEHSLNYGQAIFCFAHYLDLW